MKHIRLNEELLPKKNFQLPLQNRAFRYGDALFETIAYHQGQARMPQLHLDRLHKGSQVLGFILPDSLLSEKALTKAIQELIQANGLAQADQARIRLQVWRKGAGLYHPVSNEVNYLIEAAPLPPRPKKAKKKVGFAKSIQLAPSTLSPLKTGNALPYILAAKEREERGMEDLILLDLQGHVSECCASNLFWKTGHQYFTPDLGTGCIDGVMRRHVMDSLKKNGANVSEVMAHPEELLKAEQVFCTNALGIQAISAIGDRYFQEGLGPIQQWGP